MYKSSNLEYIIKTTSGEMPKSLETLLNQMAEEGWDLYSMHEIEVDDDTQFNCIFVREKSDNEEEDDVVNITTFKSRMEKMLYAQSSPYETCKELQLKIQQKRKDIGKIKDELELSNVKTRKNLNDKMSEDLKELETLRQNLSKSISPDLMYSKIGQEKLLISLSGEILELVNPDFKAPLVAETVKIRQKLTDELGYVIPKIMFEDDDKLSACEYCIKLRGIEVFNSFVYPEYLMFFEKDINLEKKYKNIIHGVDEISGENVIWIPEDKTKSFWDKGLNASEVVARALRHVAIKYVDDILDYSDINKYMEFIGEKNLFLIENVIPDFISVAQLRFLLASLIREEVPVKDIIYIFEKINDFSDQESNGDLLDKIRMSLSRNISKKFADNENVIKGFELSEKTLQALYDRMEDDDGIVRVDGIAMEKLVKNILKQASKKNAGSPFVIIFSPIEIRHTIFMVLSQFISNIFILAKEEITNDYEIEILGEV